MLSTTPSPVGLELLRAKYAQMLAMRLEHEAGQDDDEDVRRRMVELALRYPGALREIDELAIGEIQGRIDGLDRALRGEGETAEWMRAIGLFHALMRGALCAKRWLAGRKTVDARVEESYSWAAGGLAFPDDARIWQGALARVASPPGGRVSALVLERIAEHLGTSEAGAKRLVFGEGRAARRGGPTERSRARLR